MRCNRGARLVSTDAALLLLNPQHTCSLFQHCWRVNEKYIFWEAWSCHFLLKNPSRELAWKPELCSHKSLILLCICERTQSGWCSDAAWVNTAFSIQCIAINLLETNSKGDIILVNNVKYHSNIMGFIQFLNSFLWKKKLSPSYNYMNMSLQNLADVGCVVVWQ